MICMLSQAYTLPVWYIMKEIQHEDIQALLIKRITF